MRASSLHNSQRVTPGIVWQRTLRWFGWTPNVSMPALRQLCLDMIDDVPPGQKQGLVSRIAHLRRRDELSEIKPHLFAAVSKHHGEREARTRVQWLDSKVS